MTRTSARAPLSLLTAALLWGPASPLGFQDKYSDRGGTADGERLSQILSACYIEEDDLEERRLELDDSALSDRDAGDFGGGYDDWTVSVRMEWGEERIDDAVRGGVLATSLRKAPKIMREMCLTSKIDGAYSDILTASLTGEVLGCWVDIVDEEDEVKLSYHLKNVTVESVDITAEEVIEYEDDADRRRRRNMRRADRDRKKRKGRGRRARGRRGLQGKRADADDRDEEEQLRYENSLPLYQWCAQFHQLAILYEPTAVNNRDFEETCVLNFNIEKDEREDCVSEDERRARGRLRRRMRRQRRLFQNKH